MGNFMDLGTHGDSTAVIDSSGTAHTYRELLRDAARFADSVTLPWKSLLFIHMVNSYEALAGYLGTLMADCACMLLNPRTHPDLLDNLESLYLPDFVYKPVAGETSFALERRFVERPYAIHPLVKLLIPTSGSTGSPKIVKLSLDNLDENAKSIASYLELTETERPLLSLPIHYVYGLSIVNSHLRVGAALLLTDGDILQSAFWSFFKTHQATSLAGVPYSYELYKRLGVLDMELPSLRCMTQAGGKLSRELVTHFGAKLMEKGRRFYVMYGQTEASPRMAWLPWDECLRKPDSIGIPVPGGRLEIRDDKDVMITMPGVEGELVYIGKNVMLGYATSGSDLARGDDTFGVLHTGDLGYRDEEGFFFVTGRKSRFLKISGNRYGLDEIEVFLRALQLDCAVGGVDEQLVIAMTDAFRMTEVKGKICEIYKLHSLRVKMLHVSEIPRGENGKPLYKELFNGLT